MKQVTDSQKTIIESLGGVIAENGSRIYFKFDQSVTDDNGETITLAQAIEIENKMMDMGFDGALIGTPFNDGDHKGLFFEIN